MGKTIKHKKMQGLTLIEVLVTTVILGMLGAGLLTLQFVLGQNQTLVVQNYLSIDEANSFVSEFVRQIRTARSGDNAAYVLDTVDDFEIIFYSDYDFDGETERVRYTLTGTQLERGIIEPTVFPVSYPIGNETTKILSNNIRNDTTPAFYFYNDGWPQDTINNPLVAADRLSDARTIRIFLRLNQKANDINSDYLLESFSQIRMLKDNL